MDRALILGRGRMLASGTLTTLRAATRLPNHLFLHSLSHTQRLDVLADPILAGCIETSSAQGLKLAVPQEQKSGVLHHLLQKVPAGDFSVEPPSLQSVFHYYMETVCHSQPQVLSTDTMQVTHMAQGVKWEAAV